MDKILISVIIPVFNREKYIKEAINSILEQTIQDFEIIVVDDASTDCTLQQVEQIGDKRINILKNEEHLGVSLSRNRGLQIARGEYVAYMDSDDISHPSRFEKQINYLKANPDVQACGCWLQCFGKSSHIIKHKETHEEIQAQLLLKNSMSLGATTIEKAAFDQILFDKNKLHVEDYEYWVQAAWNCRLANLQEVLYYYRTHEEQVSSLFLEVQREQDISIKLDLFKKIDKELVEKNSTKITEVIFSQHPLDSERCQFFFDFLSLMKERNKQSKAFDQKQLEKNIDVLKNKFVFDIYFTNSRELNQNDRLQIFKVLPLREKIFILSKKLREKYKLLTNRLSIT